MRSDERDLLTAGIRELHLSLTDVQTGLLERYTDEVMLWNPTHKLVGAEGKEFVVKHILDSLSGANAIKNLAKAVNADIVCDLGSGAGLPGIPLAAALPELGFVLVERMARRVGFLRNTVAVLGLQDRVRIIGSDIKDIREKFPLITFRAFRPLSEILPEVEKILAPGGIIASYQSKTGEKNAEEGSKGLFEWENVPLRVPFLEEERCLITLVRHA